MVLAGIQLTLRHIFTLLLPKLGETLQSGRVDIVLAFEPPLNAAFPRDQPTITSYVLGQRDTVVRPKENIDMGVDDGTFTEEAIQVRDSWLDEFSVS